MRFAVEQIGQRLRAYRPSGQIGHAPSRIGDTARAAGWITRASLRKAPARVARERPNGIRTKLLRSLDSRPGIQAITEGQTRIGKSFRHRRASDRDQAGIWVHDMFSSRRRGQEARMQPALRVAVGFATMN